MVKYDRVCDDKWFKNKIIDFGSLVFEIMIYSSISQYFLSAVQSNSQGFYSLWERKKIKIIGSRDTETKSLPKIEKINFLEIFQKTQENTLVQKIFLIF